MSAHQEMLKEVSEETGFKQYEVDTVMRGIAEVVRKKMMCGEHVRLFGIGKFYIVQRKARIGRNNMTGEVGKPVEIPARKAIKFKPLTILTAAARGE